MRGTWQTTDGGGSGGLILLAIAAAVVFGSGAGAAASVIVAALIAVVVVVALALGGLVAFLVYRARRQSLEGRGYAPYAVRQVRADLVSPAVQTPERPALEAPAVRLDPGQLAELAEILRRERP